jgi:nicotinamidase-related amidase
MSRLGLAYFDRGRRRPKTSVNLDRGPATPVFAWELLGSRCGFVLNCATSIELKTMENDMKRRTFLGLVAGTPILASKATAQGRNDHASAFDRRGQLEADATPVPPIDAQRAALLVMDYQHAWIQTLTNTDALLSQATQAISIAREHGALVVYTLVAFTPADYAAVPEHNIIFSQLASQPGLLDEDAPDTAIDHRVAPEPGDNVVRKTRVGAFARTGLDEWLRDLAIDTLILAGISTSGVVLSTVCDAADRDYRIVVLADACANREPEIQDLLIGKIFPQRAQVITVAQLPALLQPVS